MAVTPRRKGGRFHKKPADQPAITTSSSAGLTSKEGLTLSQLGTLLEQAADPAQRRKNGRQSIYAQVLLPPLGPSSVESDRLDLLEKYHVASGSSGEIRKKVDRKGKGKEILVDQVEEDEREPSLLRKRITRRVLASRTVLGKLEQVTGCRYYYVGDKVSADESKLAIYYSCAQADTIKRKETTCAGTLRLILSLDEGEPFSASSNIPSISGKSSKVTKTYGSPAKARRESIIVRIRVSHLIDHSINYREYRDLVRENEVKRLVYLEEAKLLFEDLKKRYESVVEREGAAADFESVEQLYEGLRAISNKPGGSRHEKAKKAGRTVRVNKKRKQETYGQTSSEEEDGDQSAEEQEEEVDELVSDTEPEQEQRYNEEDYAGMAAEEADQHSDTDYEEERNVTLPSQRFYSGSKPPKAVTASKDGSRSAKRRRTSGL